jgi:hypothetical protein
MRERHQVTYTYNFPIKLYIRAIRNFGLRFRHSIHASIIRGTVVYIRSDYISTLVKLYSIAWVVSLVVVES